MNDFQKGLRKLLWVRRVKKPFNWLVMKLERKEADLIDKYDLF